MPFRPSLPFWHVALAGAAALVSAAMALPAHAQFKVVGPDGRITYTDRAPTSQEGTGTALGVRIAAAPAEVELPFELRQVVSRYPVTLYVVPGVCEPCELARALLRQRGVPHAEKRVESAEDVQGMEKITGTRDTPTLTVGSQVLRGMTAELWNQYLDAAGYPRVSRLPPTYQPRPATPVAERREVPVSPVATAQRPEASPVRTSDRPQATSGGIRF